MKLTQKTLFQCFDKSRPSSPVPNPSQGRTTAFLVSSLDSCSRPTVTSSNASQAKNSDEQQEIHACHSNFLLPVHIRQLDGLSATERVPLLTTRRPIDDQRTYSFQQFTLPTADIDRGFNHFPKMKVLHLPRTPFFSSSYRLSPFSASSMDGWAEYETTLIYLSSIPFQLLPVCSTEHQAELFQQYTRDQPMVDWQSMFTSLQETRQKAMEQSRPKRECQRAWIVIEANLSSRSMRTVTMDGSVPAATIDNIPRQSHATSETSQRMVRLLDSEVARWSAEESRRKKTQTWIGWLWWRKHPGSIYRWIEYVRLRTNPAFRSIFISFVSNPLIEFIEYGPTLNWRILFFTQLLDKV